LSPSMCADTSFSGLWTYTMRWEYVMQS
jgi:hypothetical protein